MAPPKSKTGSTASAAASRVLDMADALSRMLVDIADATNIPYLQAVAGLSHTMSDSLQSVKTNKDECLQLVKHATEALSVFVNVCHDTRANLGPAMLHHVAHLTRTLEMIVTYLQKRSKSSLLKRLVRPSEDAFLLAEARAGLDQVLTAFEVSAHVMSNEKLVQLQEQIVKDHEVLLESLKKIRMLESASRLSVLLPSEPQIFYGREDSVKFLVRNLTDNNSLGCNHAILGTGGIGKSSLALVVLHHPDIVQTYADNRFFVTFEAAITLDDVLTVLATYFQLESSGKAGKRIVDKLQSLSMKTPVLLVLDNFETPWESFTNREELERFLGQITSLQRVSVIVTMRGIERPKGTRWATPALPPLHTLTPTAAREIFLDVSDAPADDPHLDEVIYLSGYVPLVVTLLGNLAQVEDCASILESWRLESTSLLSDDGIDARSNLDISISISLCSPRLANTPDAIHLLSVLSILPDGLSASTLTDIKLPIRDAYKCKLALCRTSLAHVDEDGRIKVLVPVREFMQTKFPVSSELLEVVSTYYYSIANLTTGVDRVPEIVRVILPELGNIYAIARHVLLAKGTDITRTVECLVTLAEFTKRTSLGSLEMFHSIKNLADGCDKNVAGRYHLIRGRFSNDARVWEEDLTESLRLFQESGDISGQGMALGHRKYYKGARAEGLRLSRLSLELCRKAGDLVNEARITYNFGQMAVDDGMPHLALPHCQRALELGEIMGNMYVQSQALGMQARCFHDMGYYGLGDKLENRALSILESLGYSFSSSQVYLMGDQAAVHMARSEYEQAKEIYMRMSQLDASNGGVAFWVKNDSWPGLAMAHLRCGTYNSAELDGRIEESLQNYLQAGNIYGPLECRLAKAYILLYAGDTASSLRAFRDILRQASEIRHSVVVKGCLEAIMAAELTVRNVGALVATVTSFAYARLRSDLRLTHLSLLHLGDIFLCQGAEDDARMLFEYTLDGFRAMGIHRFQGDCLMRLGEFWSRRGAVEKAVKMLEAAIPYYERSSQMMDASLCKDRIQMLSGH
ncbi:hypothetical protein FISHEDRAFT_63060 [Fistulina hepatica ATCC 64428]|uniref:Novel STAND NTPase 1 domain-containing protein n=1 Tax=Fistulina hepatica ATCC 64428 TaxID=1128425 RepID=A0A0D6ZZK5_9AGAR|nr:hypothetical protein FISHEDRAFT_63060 [Fistulina hepatica ATCC 64428]